MVTSTSQRVEANTSGHINQEIQNSIKTNLEKYSRAGKLAIQRRLQKLDREWTTERVIEVEAPLMIALGSSLTYFFGRKFLPLPIFSASMLLLHGVKGWYPLLPLFRRMGFRSQNEILQERKGLLEIKALKEIL
jgi:hypothetical protein